MKLTVIEGDEFSGEFSLKLSRFLMFLDLKSKNTSGTGLQELS